VRRLFDDLPAEPASIRIDVTEDAKNYLVKAEIPGVKKEDITVEVEGNQVSIAAEVRRETEGKDGEVVHSERYYGKQFRSFALGRDIDRKNVLAKYAEGVLELTLPKNGAPVAEKISIL
jgi:HSP20 family protein